MAIDRPRATRHLKAFDFVTLFIEELGWDRPGSRQPEMINVGGQDYRLSPVADKRGVRIFHCPEIPDRALRQYIEREITKRAFEHLIIFTDEEKTRQIWQWVAREKGKPAAFREHIWLANSAPDPLIQKLDHIAFTLNDEEGLTLSGTTLRMRDAFDREKITKRFYEDFKKQHDRFLGFIDGLANMSDRQWYASLMLNRLMFVYFIQKKRFLNGDIDYLKTKLAEVRAEKGDDQFHTFYRAFLLKLFHGGLATPANTRDADTARLLGNIPYLNGGLFEPHALEADGNDIQIADAAFEAVFNFFDQYEWTLDTRPIEQADGKEINPDVLGHIFEKYINQKQMGAYYTKEDITDYITKNTVIPWLFQNAIAHDKVAFEPGSAVWRMLSENPDAYIYPAVKHGADQPLPDNIAAGIDDVAKRGDWNKTAPASLGLPTETWRELVARRERYARARFRRSRISSPSISISASSPAMRFNMPKAPIWSVPSGKAFQRSRCSIPPADRAHSCLPRSTSCTICMTPVLSGWSSSSRALRMAADRASSIPISAPCSKGSNATPTGPISSTSRSSSITSTASISWMRRWKFVSSAYS